MKILFQSSEPSSGRSDYTLQALPKRDYLLLVEHEESSDHLFFQRVEALQIIFHKACSIEMISAYDRVTDLGNTTWLKEIRSRLETAGESVDGLRHLMIYLDDGPCYEFVCHGFMAETKENA